MTYNTSTYRFYLPATIASWPDRPICATAARGLGSVAQRGRPHAASRADRGGGAVCAGFQAHVRVDAGKSFRNLVAAGEDRVRMTAVRVDVTAGGLENAP